MPKARKALARALHSLTDARLTSLVGQLEDAVRRAMEALGFKLLFEEEAVSFLIREHARKYSWGCSHATAWVRQSARV